MALRLYGEDVTKRGSPSPDPYADFGTWVRAARLNRGLSRRELAERAGISVPYVTKIENGDRRPQAPVISRLADALEVSPAMLLQTPEMEESRVWRRPVQGAPPPPGAAARRAGPGAASIQGALPGVHGVAAWTSHGPEERPGRAADEPDQAVLLSHAMRLIADADPDTLRAVVSLLESAAPREEPH